MEDIKFYIPFEGFYYSVYEGMVESIIDNEIQDGYLKNDDDINYKSIFEAMAESIFDDIIEIFIDETDINSLYSNHITYEGLSSPTYYNYSTDKLMSKICYNNYKLIWDKYIINKDFVNYVNEASKSRDGFSSFYEGINHVASEPSIFLEYLFEWFVLNKYRDEIINKTTDNLHEIIYNNLTL